MRKIIVLFTLIFFFSIIYAQTNKVILYFFWSNTCPHCAAEEIFLKKLEKKYPELEIRSYEIHKPENIELFKLIAKNYGFEPEGVPTTFIGDKYIVGYFNDNTTGKEIENLIKKCLREGCIDPMEKLSNTNITNIVELPGLGTINTTKINLPIFTLIIAGLDSLNPCAFFILLFLLTMLIYAQSRKKILIIGFTYVFFSGLIYFLFMSAWLNLFLIVGKISVITTIAGIVALLIGAINIKDYFFYKRGISLTIPEKAKPKLFKRMRNLLKADSLKSMMFGTIVLAIAVNFYELLCTAGFPMIYTRILTLYKMSNIYYYLYLIFYNIIYVIPLTIIVILFAITLGSKRLTEEQGQSLKLLSGFMMFYLSLILLFNAAALSNTLVSISILILAVVSTSIIIFITNKFKNYDRKLS